MKFLILITVALGSVQSLSAQTNLAPAPLEFVPNTAVQPSTPTQIDPFSDPLIKQVQARHDKAVAGDDKEAKALTTDLEKWTAEQPTNYLLQAYLGSVYTLDSRDSWWGPTKLDYLKKGGKWLDGAVSSAPENPAVRFIRAIDYFELPSIFGKHQTARDDFQVLLKQIDGETHSPYLLNIETQQAIYYYAGLSFKQLSQMPQAKDAWVRGYKLAPNSDLGKKIGDELMKVK
jgi:hypothetical protein